MASIEKDSVSGQMTTGHEWDGIKELNTPLPRWWVWVFWACVIWSIGYWVLMPTWPTPSGFTQGTLGYSSRATLDEDLKAQKAQRSKFTAKLAATPLEDISKDKDLLNFALTGGKVAFGENCSACHGMGGVGKPGAYPTLADDEWLWGGTLADIQQTITHGVRNEDAESRQSEMPKFGADGLLTKEQIAQVSDYVASLAAKAPAAGTPGEQVFADNCVACHAEGGVGTKDVGAPALNNNLWLFKAGNQSVKDLVTAQVSTPKHGSMPTWAGRLDEATIKMLAVYVHSLGGGK